MEISNTIIWIVSFFVLMATLLYYYKAIDSDLTSTSSHWLKSSIFFHYIFFVGTMIHELSHALVATLLGVRVHKISLFWPKKTENGGYRLGYVEHSKVDPIRTTIIGIAPIIGCALTTYFFFLWAVPNISLATPLNVDNFLAGLIWLITNPKNPLNYVFYYIAVSCALAGDPSEADTKSLPYFALVVVFFGVAYYYTQNLSIWDGAFSGIKYISNVLAPTFRGITLIMLFEVSVLSIIFSLTRLIKPRT